MRLMRILSERLNLKDHVMMVFSMSGNITTIIGSRSQIHFSVETCC